MTIRQILDAKPGYHAVLHDQDYGGVRFLPIICWAVVDAGEGGIGTTGMVADGGDAWLTRVDEHEDFIGYANPGEEVSRHWDDLANDIMQERKSDETMTAEAKKREN